MARLSLLEIERQKWFVDKNTGYVRSHLGRRNRLVWEAMNGPIPPGFVVHHINRDRADDRIENLELMRNGDHAHHHRRPKLKVCSVCGGPVSSGKRYTRCWDCFKKAVARTCSVLPCGRRSHALGLCDSHYRRQHRRRPLVGDYGTVILQ